MSERTVSENNKMWEAAEKMAEKAVANAKAENEEERRKQKKRLTKIILMMVLIALIMIFASIAWFAMNKAVSANTMAITAAPSPFEIAVAVKGSTVRNESELTKADNTYEVGNTATYSNESYYETGGSKQKIKIRYKPVANEATDFGPDSSGVIEFYVIPKQNGTLTVKIDLDTIGFRELGTGNDKTIKRISELTTADITDQDLLASYQTAEQYLKGHIMFFEDLGDTASTTLEANRYHYKKPITTRTFEKTFTNAVKDVPQKVTIYWMWTNTLGQIALKNNTTNQRSGYPIVQDTTDDGSDISATDKGKVIRYLKDNKQQIFTNNVSDTEIENAKNADNFKKLSTGYNEADYLIGSSVSYFMIDISVQKKS